MRKRDLITTRPGKLSDEPFIYSTWLKGLRYANEWFKEIDQTVYYSNYHRIIELILNKPDTQINISTLIDDPDIILGYAVKQPTVLHWVFIKPDWRGIGLCSDLVGKDIKQVTHLTRVGLKIKPPHVIFNPFA